MRALGESQYDRCTTRLANLSFCELSDPDEIHVPGSFVSLGGRPETGLVFRRNLFQPKVNGAQSVSSHFWVLWPGTRQIIRVVDNDQGSFTLLHDLFHAPERAFPVGEVRDP